MDYNFDINHASKYGVNEAIVLKNLIYWIRQNKANRRNYIENKTWTYNTIEAWCKHYPFWSESQLRRILKSLYDQGVILKQSLGGNVRTSYYALCDESMLEMPEKLVNPPDEKPDTPPKPPEEETESAAEEIYTYYKINITIGRKGVAIKAIQKALKKQTKDILIQCVRNYQNKCVKENIQFRIQPHNFFGKEDYLDYLPKPKMKLRPPDPDCKVCGGTGELFSQATSQVKPCTCRYLKDKGG